MLQHDTGTGSLVCTLLYNTVRVYCTPPTLEQERNPQNPQFDCDLPALPSTQKRLLRTVSTGIAIIAGRRCTSVLWRACGCKCHAQSKNLLDKSRVNGRSIGTIARADGEMEKVPAPPGPGSLVESCGTVLVVVGEPGCIRHTPGK